MKKLTFPSYTREAHEEKHFLTHFQVFLIVFDHGNACASMRLLVKIHKYTWITEEGDPKFFVTFGQLQELITETKYRTLNSNNGLIIVRYPNGTYHLNSRQLVFGVRSIDGPQGAKLHMNKPKCSSKRGLGELKQVPWGSKI